jgi:hypothetical protein
MAVLAVIIFLAVAFVFLFLFFIVWFLSKEYIEHLPAQGIGWNFGLTLVSVELLLKTRLRTGSPPKGLHGNFEFSAAKVQTPTAGVVLSHLTTLRRRRTMGCFSSDRTTLEAELLGRRMFKGELCVSCLLYLDHERHPPFGAAKGERLPRVLK